LTTAGSSHSYRPNSLLKGFYLIPHERSSHLRFGNFTLDARGVCVLETVVIAIWIQMSFDTQDKASTRSYQPIHSTPGVRRFILFDGTGEVRSTLKTPLYLECRRIHSTSGVLVTHRFMYCTDRRV